MIKTNTSSERVDALTGLSDAVYDIIEQSERNDYLRSRQVLRLGVHAVANTIAMNESIQRAGNRLHAHLHQTLTKHGLIEGAYRPWPQYDPRFESSRHIAPDDPRLDILTLRYADVRRGTIDSHGDKETDATHVVHLASLALPYAAEYYPHLDQNKLALYAWFHDMVEAYSGDTNSFGISPEDDAIKYSGELAALEQIKNEFSQSHPDIILLLYAYENLADDEARFIKTFDKIDPSFTHARNQGLALRRDLNIKSADDFLSKASETTKKIVVYGSEFPLVLEDRETLLNLIAQNTPWEERVF